MAKVVSPITAKIEVIGKLKESSYQPGQYYRSVLFIDLSQPSGTEEAKIWKSLSDPECEGLAKGCTVQLVPAGTDKNGKDKHNIVLLGDSSLAAVKSSADDTSPLSCEWTPDQKRAIASFVENQADLLGFCLKVSRVKFANPHKPLVETEESIRTLATSLYITTQRKFHV